jgi:hypothetical protein
MHQGIAQHFGLFSANVRSLLALRASHHIKSHTLILLQGLETTALNRGEVSEQILATTIRGDETETLGIVEPLHGTSCHVLKLQKKIKWGCPRMNTTACSLCEAQDSGVMNGEIPEARKDLVTYAGQQTAKLENRIGTMPAFAGIGKQIFVLINKTARSRAPATPSGCRQ